MGWFVKNEWVFLLTFGVIAGVGVGFGTVVPVQTTVTQWFTEKRARAMAITLTASGFGGFIAAPLLTNVLKIHRQMEHVLAGSCNCRCRRTADRHIPCAQQAGGYGPGAGWVFRKAI